MTAGVIILLALAVSIDGFSAGLSCGLRRLRIPFSSLLVICLSSAGAVAASMLAGRQAAFFIPLGIVPHIGGGVLIALGTYVLAGSLSQAKRLFWEKEQIMGWEQAGRKPEGSAGLKKLTCIARRPEEADLDQSGVLSAKEASLLGLALAADAFGAGFGAALVGLSLPLTVAAVGLTKLALVPLGVECGRLAADGVSLKAASILSGAILIFIGIVTIAR